MQWVPKRLTALLANWRWYSTWPARNPGQPSVAIDDDEPGNDATPPLCADHRQREASFGTSVSHPFHKL